MLDGCAPVQSATSSRVVAISSAMTKAPVSMVSATLDAALTRLRRFRYYARHRCLPYGKEIGGDIREGKRTLLLLHLLRTCSPDDRQRVLHVYGLPRDERTPEDVLWIVERMREYGSIEYATSASNGLAGAALAELEPVLSSVAKSDDTRFLRALVVELATRVR